MTKTMRKGLHYSAAACVGFCFGMLMGGAVVFVLQSVDPASALEWQSVLHVQSAPGR